MGHRERAQLPVFLNGAGRGCLPSGHPLFFQHTRKEALSAADLVFDQPMPLHLALELPERRIIEAALKRNNWNRQATAAELDINRTTLYKKMRKYRLDVGEAN